MNTDPVQDVLELVADGEFQEALDQLNQLIREEPYQTSFLALRALILVDLDRRAEAADDIRVALEDDSENPFVHHAAAVVALHAGEIQQAIAEAIEAQELAPLYTAAALVEARARANAGQWPRVVEIARGVLELEPDNEEAAILEQLATAADAERTPLDAAAWTDLSTRFPLNPTARTANGWSRLQVGHIRDAKGEFEQALALDPSSEWARDGLVLALKARSPVYALLLRYFMWSATLEPRTRNWLTIGGFLGYNFLRRLSKAQPELAPYLLPVLIGYGIFLFLTWLADPLLDLTLMTDAKSRALLTKDAKRGALTVGGTLGLGALLALVAAVTSWSNLLLAALPVAFSSLVFAAWAGTIPSGKRDRLGVLAIVAALTGLAAGFTPPEFSAMFMVVSIVISAGSSWYARFATARPHVNYPV